MKYYKGIDVSKWNGAINWQKAKNEIDFAILKVTKKNNNIEESFMNNYEGCKVNNIPVGVYKYVYATGIKTARDEGQAIVNALKGKSVECGVWLDIEDKSLAILSKETLNSIIITMANILESNGYYVGIYCNKDWYYNKLDYKYLSERYPFWIARYPLNDKGILNIDSKLNPKDYAKAWQYSSKGNINGIKGNVDLNVAFVDLSQLMTTRKINEYFPKYIGNSGSIVCAMESLGLNSSYEHRKLIAKSNDIQDYTGTAMQNIYLLNLLKSGMLKR